MHSVPFRKARDCVVETIPADNRRAGVTVALHDLEGRRLIKAIRGQITVLDRIGIEKLANGFYSAPENEYFHLVATPMTRRSHA